MHRHSAITPFHIAHLITACVLSLFLTACGGGSGGTGDQSDQRPPVANAEIIGLFPETTTSEKVFSTRANNKITLTGKNSLAPDTPILTYKWEQLSGEPVTLIARTGESSVFTTPNLTTTSELRFQLTVTDANQKTDTDTLTLTVAPVDDVDRFLSNPAAPVTQLKLLAALQGGTSTGASDQPFSIEAVTVAHWRNRLGVMDEIVVHTEALNGVFPSQFSPVIDYDVLAELRNPQLVFTVHELDIDEINQNFDDSERDRRLETYAIDSAYLDIQLNVVGTPSVNFELFALNDVGDIISGSSLLASINGASPTPDSNLPPTSAQPPVPTTAATNGALLQTWNSEFSALLLSDNLLAALGLDNKTSANNYYTLIDPTAQFTHLSDWLAYAGFDIHSQTSTDPTVTQVDYFNNYDLGYGRKAWMRKDTNGNVFAYITNYPSVEDSLQCRQDFSAFAMEYSDNPDPQGTNAKIVKFYAFVPDVISGQYIRTTSINIDGRGEKMVPGVCTSCHQTNTAITQFTSTAEADLGAVFLPFDLDSFLFANAANKRLIEPTFNASKFSAEELTKHSRETQEEAFRQLNLNVLTTYEADPVRHSAAIELIHGWYGDVVSTQASPLTKPTASATAKKPLPTAELPTTTFDGDYVQPGWVGEETLYRNVFIRHCRSCHVQINDDAINFDNYSEFINSNKLISHVYEQGLMPLSRTTMDRFWVSFYGEESSADLLRGHLEALNQTIPDAPGVPVPKFTDTFDYILDTQLQTVTNKKIILNASDSSFAKTYSWSLTAPNGSTATLSNTSGLIASFVPDMPQASYDVTLTVTNSKNQQATLTKTLSGYDLAPLAECFNANSSGLTDSGLLANIPVMSNLNFFGDGGVTIESVLSGTLGTATVDQNALTISYQLNDPFVRGVDTINYRLQDADGTLSNSSPNCTSSPANGFATITIDTTTAGTLAPPTLLAELDAVNNSNTVNLSWTAPSAITVEGYNLYRNSTGTGIPLNGNTPLTQTSFVDTGLTENTNFDYSVVSVIGNFTSNPTTASVITLSLTPTNLMATSISEGQINLNWTAPTGNVDNYAVYRDGSSTPLTLVSSGITSLADTAVTGGNQYTYTVTAILGNTESPLSNSVVGTTFPDTPSAPTGTVISDTQIDVSWTPINCSGTASYLLTPSNVTAIPTTSTSMSVTGLTPATSYTFTVSAQCHGLTSADSAASTALTTLAITPSSLAALSVSNSRIDLSWIPASGTIDSYAIYRNGSSTPVATVPANQTSYSDLSLTSGSQYTYVVTAKAGTYESPASNSVIAFTYPDVPAAPVASPLSDTEIDVNWTPINCNTVPNYTLIASADHSPIITNALGGTVAGLTPDTSYTFTLTAECNGLVSAASPSSTPVSTLSITPMSLIATSVNTGQIDLSWTESTGAIEAYAIYQDGASTPIATISAPATSYSASSLGSGSQYNYTVTAIAGTYESQPTPSVVGTTYPSAPFTPTAVAVSENQIDVSWFAVFCSSTATYTVTTVDFGTINTTATSVSITGLTPDTPYSFSVSATCNGLTSTDSGTSSPVNTVSLTPSSLVANSISTSQIDLSWAASTGTVDGYAIYRDGDPTPLATVSAPNTTFSDTGLLSGDQHNYVVTAIAGAYESAPTAISTGQTFPDAPTTPTAIVISNSQIDVNWTSVGCKGSLSYLLSPSGLSDISTTAINTSVTGLMDDTQYSFKVTAVCNGLTSASSPASSPVKTFSLAPTNLVAIGGPGVITLNWDPAFGPVDTYQIYREGSPYDSVPAPTTTWNDPEVAGGETITYTVTAMNGTIESAPSNSATATTVPDAPMGVSGSAQDLTTVDTFWDPTFCQGTLVYLLNNADVGTITTPNTTFTLTGLTPSTAHEFSVQAVCNGMVSNPTTACAGSTCP